MPLEVALLCLLCVFLYGLLLVWHAWHFVQLSPPVALPYPLPAVAVIVPARNEAQLLPACLGSLLSQQYAGQWQVIVVNDHSEDTTAALAAQWQQTHPQQISCVHLPAGVQGKKAALAAGISASQAQVIVTMDADCTVGPHWLTALLVHMPSDAVLVAGPVAKMPLQPSFFHELQALEAAGMMAIAAAAIAAGSPTMANGANLAFSKAAFMAVGGYKGIDQVASGDDELLLRRLHKAYPGGIRFAKDARAIVSTPTLATAAQLRQQRLRWVSKSRAYHNPLMSLQQVIAYLAMLGLAALAGAGCWHPSYWLLLAAGLAFKAGAEAVILWPATAFFQQQRLMRRLLPGQLAHLPYVLWVGIAGNLVQHYEWKGRRVR